MAKDKLRTSKWPGAKASFVETLEARTLLSAATTGVIEPDLLVDPNASGGTSIQGYTPSEIKNAYDFSGLTVTGGSAGNGSGQTIAIVDAYNDPDITSDLATFDAEFGLSAPPSFKVVDQTGSTQSLPATNSGWAGEISLDVEWAHAIAPAANILLVEATSDDTNNLLTAVNYASQALGVTVVSMSWGSSEFFGETSDDSYFTTPSWHKGVTFIAASGDEGSRFGPEWPASSDNVLAVGGTTLNTTSSGAYSSESTWSDSTDGYSQFESEPSYQETAQNSGARSTADVSYDANPNTGFAVYDSISYNGQSGWQEFGGTSAGSPQWAALIAIANQARKAAGERVLADTSATSTILYGLYSSASSYDSAFHDVVGGSSRSSSGATTGYDLSTGLGTPIASELIQALVQGGTSSSSAKGAVVSGANVSFSMAVVGSNFVTVAGGAGNVELIPPQANGSSTGSASGGANYAAVVFSRNSLSPIQRTYVPSPSVALQNDSALAAVGISSERAGNDVVELKSQNTIAMLTTSPIASAAVSSLGFGINYARLTAPRYPSSDSHAANFVAAGIQKAATTLEDISAGLWFDALTERNIAGYISNSARFWDETVAVVGLGFLALGLAGKRTPRRRSDDLVQAIEP